MAIYEVELWLKSPIMVCTECSEHRVKADSPEEAKEILEAITRGSDWDAYTYISTGKVKLYSTDDSISALQKETGVYS